MTTPSPSENMVEDLAAVDFGSLIYAVKRGVEIDDAGERANASQLVLTNRLIAALHRLNPELSNEQCEQVACTLTRPPHPTLIQNNRWFHNLLTDGVEVEYRDATTGETRGGRARLINFEQPEKNDLLVVRQLTVVGPTGKAMRPDLTVFLNGLPIAVIELKEFKARLEVEAGLFVDWRRGRIGPRGASWRPFRALAFVIADRGSGPDSAERATLPRKRSDARIAVNRRA